MILNKNAIFDKIDYSTMDVDVSEWGGIVRIRSLSLRSEFEFDQLSSENKSNLDLALFLIVNSCIDSDGNLIFNNDTDLDLLKQKSSSGILKLYNAILTLNNKNENCVEELAKNL